MAIPEDPQLRAVHEDIVTRLEHDARLRKVEQDLAALRLLPAEMQRMESRIVAALVELKGDLKPKPVWPAVSALAAVLGVVLIITAALYGTP